MSNVKEWSPPIPRTVPSTSFAADAVSVFQTGTMHWKRPDRRKILFPTLIHTFWQRNLSNLSGMGSQ